MNDVLIVLIFFPLGFLAGTALFYVDWEILWYTLEDWWEVRYGRYTK